MADPTPTERTPVPSDWQQAKVLIKRNFSKDKRKPRIYFAKFFFMPCLLMLYCLGFLFQSNAFAAEDPPLLQAGFEFFEGEDWTYPRHFGLAGGDLELVTSVKQSLGEFLRNESGTDDIELTILADFDVNNQTTFYEDCQANVVTSDSNSGICVWLEDVINDEYNYTLFFGGKEGATPFQKALAGAQWAINQALLADTTGTAFPVSQVQRIPRKDIPKSADNTKPLDIILLLPAVMHVLAAAIAVQFLAGPITYEKINHVADSFFFVGVKAQTYFFAWISYFAMNFVFTAGLLTIVSEYWNLMPLSSPGLIFASHYLGLVHMMSAFTLYMQFLQQEELAQSFPFLFGLVNMGIGAVLLLFDYVDHLLMYILSIPLPFVGMMQYYGLYATYDATGVDTGIIVGENAVDSGLLGSYIAQIVGILFYWTLLRLYSSQDFMDRLLGRNYGEVEQGEEAIREHSKTEESPLSGDSFEPLAPGSDVLIQVRGVEHTYRPTRWEGKEKEATTVLKGLDMDICRGEVFGYLGHNGAGSKWTLRNGMNEFFF